MAVALNHTIVAAADAEASARWLADMFGLAAPERFGHFWQVTLAGGLGLDFASSGGEPIVPQHYAFLVPEATFDEVHGRLLLRDLDFWADPGQRHPGEINRHDGGRGVYFLSNDGHFLEAITRPYGSGSAPPTEVVAAAFAAYRAQDAEAMAALLADDFTFTSPQDDHIDKAAFLERCFPTAARLASQEVLELVDSGAGDGSVFIRYEYVLADTGARHRNTEHSRVRDGRLVETEVYFGGAVRGPGPG